MHLFIIKLTSMFFLVISAFTATSQNYIDLLSAGCNYNPNNKYEDSDSSFNFSHYLINLQYPHVFENKDIFLAKLSLNQYRSTEENFPDLYIIYLQLGGQIHLGDKSSFKFAVTPKIASCMKDVDGNDFIVPVTGLIQFKPSENLTWGAGFLYSYEYFGHYLNPAFHVNWKINDKWLFYADFPSHGYFMYYPGKRFKGGFYASSSTTSIRLSQKYNNCYIQKSYSDFSLFLDTYLSKSVVLRIKGGYSSMRSLDMYEESAKVPFTFSLFEFGDERTQLNRDIDDVLFFEVTLNYRYHY